MNSVVLEPATWKMPRWLSMLVLIFVSQLLLIYLLSARGNVTARTLSIQPVSVQIYTEQLGESEFSKELLVNDPTLFAMANPRSFSGAAWLKAPTRNYDLAAPAEKPFWLKLDSSQLGSGIAQFVRANAVAPLPTQESSAPIILALQIPDPTINIKNSSRLRVEGDLASRDLIERPQLQSWAHSEIVSSTIAQVLVDGRGMVLSAKLLSRSGLADADRTTLEIVRNLQFTPNGEREPVWGKIIFDWHTIPTAQTNISVKAPQL
jgi:hypothetical protein